jgi:hypothetical protein
MLLSQVKISCNLATLLKMYHLLCRITHKYFNSILSLLIKLTALKIYSIMTKYFHNMTKTNNNKDLKQQFHSTLNTKKNKKFNQKSNQELCLNRTQQQD